MQADEMTVELYSSWRNHPVTQVLFALMEKQIADAQESWISGHFDNADIQAMVIEQKRWQERAGVYRALINQTGEEFLQAIGGE